MGVDNTTSGDVFCSYTIGLTQWRSGLTSNPHNLLHDPVDSYDPPDDPVSGSTNCIRLTSDAKKEVGQLAAWPTTEYMSSYRNKYKLCKLISTHHGFHWTLLHLQSVREWQKSEPICIQRKKIWTIDKQFEWCRVFEQFLLLKTRCQEHMCNCCGGEEDKAAID